MVIKRHEKNLEYPMAFLIYTRKKNNFYNYFQKIINIIHLRLVKRRIQFYSRKSENVIEFGSHDVTN